LQFTDADDMKSNRRQPALRDARVPVPFLYSRLSALNERNDPAFLCRRPL